jgi:signal transduction histidine kinase
LAGRTIAAVTATWTAPLPVRAAASVAARGGFRARFLANFNWTTIALAFYVCFLMVLTFHLPAIPGRSAEEWWFSLAYGVRQNQVSAFFTLFAVALADAWLPTGVRPRLRALGVLLIVMVAISVSAYIRISIGRASMTATTDVIRWVVYVLTLWTLVGMLGYGVACALRREREVQQALNDARCAQDELSARALQARLLALQAQIEPHFLFNTLANVKRLYETDTQRARQMLGSLIAYLRAALPSIRQSGSTVAREADLARSYLTILQMRMGTRLAFTIDVDPEVADCALPPLVLATLVENSIKHGLGALPEGGRIDISARAEADELVVTVADTGRGFTSSSGSGVGLANTRSRLLALYGEQARLLLRANEPAGVIAEVRLPRMAADALAALTQPGIPPANRPEMVTA